MKWILAFHLIAMVAWFAGLFYLPRLYVYHTESTDAISHERFCRMEYKLFFYIMNPSALLTIFLGFWLIALNPNAYLHENWMHAKLILVFALVVFHLCCGLFLMHFRANKNRHSGKFYRYFNEIPTLLLIAIILLAVVNP